MTDGAHEERFTSLGESGSGIPSVRSNATRGSLNWPVLLAKENGGPGETPGRTAAIERATARTEARYALHGKKLARGSASKKPTATVSRKAARSKGL